MIAVDGTTHTLVLGGGMAGMLTASVLAAAGSRVTVVEPDTFPDLPGPRRGLPQGHHNHMFMAGGVEALESMLPGTVEALTAAGAHRRGLPGGILTLSAEGWYHRHETGAWVLACSRALLDHVMRDRVLRDERIELREGSRAVGLLGDRERVTGAQVMGTGDGPGVGVGTEADLVVDATGRGSRAAGWLGELGVPPVREDRVDAGFAYACRFLRAPDGLGPDFPGVLIQAGHGDGTPGRGGALMPIEDGRWIVALIGTHGACPPTDEAGFAGFARSLADPVVADLIDLATPDGPIRSYRGLANVRRHYDSPAVPDGFVVLGDAATTLNPNYATGLSVAALQAQALGAELAGAEPGPGFAGRARKAVARVVAEPWTAAVGNDQWFPGTTSTLRQAPQALRRFAARFARTTTADAALADLSFQVAALLRPQASMMGPGSLLKVLRGPRQEPLSRAQAVGQYPEIGRLYPDGARSPATRR